MIIYNEKFIENRLVEGIGKIDYALGYEVIGQQVATSVGIIDILCTLKHGVATTPLYTPQIIEVKKGKAPDSVVGQVLSYCSVIEEWLYDGIFGKTISDMPTSCWAEIRPNPIVVAESLGEMGEKAWRAGVIDFWKYSISDDALTFEPVHRPVNKLFVNAPPNLAWRIIQPYAIAASVDCFSGSILGDRRNTHFDSDLSFPIWNKGGDHE